MLLKPIVPPNERRLCPAADSTPGRARTRSSRSVSSCARRTVSLAASRGTSTPSASTPCGSKPTGKELRRMRVSPRTPRRPAARRPARSRRRRSTVASGCGTGRRCRASRSASAGCPEDPRIDGATPNTTVVTALSNTANRSTRASNVTPSIRGRCSGASAIRPGVIHHAAATPRAPPPIASTTLSTSICGKPASTRSDRPSNRHLVTPRSGVAREPVTFAQAIRREQA